MSVDNMYPNRDNAGEDLFEYAEGDTYSDLSEKLSQFNEAREVTYRHIAHVMIGEGGETTLEALQVLGETIKQTAQSFSRLGSAILEEYPTDSSTAEDMIANIYQMDEAERIERLQLLYADGAYAVLEKQTIVSVVQEILTSEYEDDGGIADNLELMYGQYIASDTNECLKGAPKNKSELRIEKRRARNEKIRHVAIEAGKIAASSVLTAALLHKVRK